MLGLACGIGSRRSTARGCFGNIGVWLSGDFAGRKHSWRRRMPRTAPALTPTIRTMSGALWPWEWSFRIHATSGSVIRRIGVLRDLGLGYRFPPGIFKLSEPLLL